MTDCVHSDWRLAQIEALESKIMELNDENIKLRNALEEIKNKTRSIQTDEYMDTHSRSR